MAKRNHQPLDIDGIMKGKQFESFERTLKERHTLQGSSKAALERLKLEPCRLAQLKQGTAVIEAPSAVWLSRLKQLKFSLLSELRKELPGLISLEFTINPKLASIKPEPQQEIIKQPEFSSHAAQYISEIRETLQKSRK